MPLLNIIVTLVVVGIILWAINSYIPMEARIKSILNVVVIVVLLLWLLQVFGLLAGLSNVTVGP